MARPPPPLPGQTGKNKRKQPPTAPPPPSSKKSKPSAPPPRANNSQAAKSRLARNIPTAAFPSGTLDAASFIAARTYEITALSEGMARSKQALTKRALQQVPRELRRRTASHDVKRVPKRLRGRAGREMKEDNTPAKGKVGKRKLDGKARLRVETAKKLRALGAKRRKERTDEEKVSITPVEPAKAVDAVARPVQAAQSTLVKTRAPKSKKAVLAAPPTPKSRFRARQIHKSWLPTHLYHAKRFHMSPPSAPLWRFSLPVSPTQKSYRPTHRASSVRGAVVWDMSYMATISLEGREEGVLGLMKALEIGVEEGGVKGAKLREKWRRGTRVWEGWAKEREEPRNAIAPVTVVWCASDVLDAARKRKALIRVHPSAFLQLWTEVVRLGKIAKPQVSVEDLRFEIGSIEIVGPGAMEALQAALWPVLESQAVSGGDATAMDVDTSTSQPPNNVESTFKSLAGLTNSALLPTNALLAFNISDPRLHHPPRPATLPTDQHTLLETLAGWPVDTSPIPASIFDRKCRLRASATLPSQKAINRRRTLAPPGEYPAPSEKDPRIPVLLYTSTTSSSFTLLLPWKCVLPVWYSLLYCPLSTGQQPSPGGLEQQRQIAFERGGGWFPGDSPGTKAGWEWDGRERERRWREWSARPKAKRADFNGEEGWACAWEDVVTKEEADGGQVIEEVVPETTTPASPVTAATDTAVTATVDATRPAEQTDPLHATTTTDASAQKPKKPNTDTTRTFPPQPSRPSSLYQLSANDARSLLAAHPPLTLLIQPNIDPSSALMTVRITMSSKGTPKQCARIYRLPGSSDQALHDSWMKLLPSKQHYSAKSKRPPPPPPRAAVLPKDAPTHEQQRYLAASLLLPATRPKAGEAEYPACPGKEYLIGYVTTGNFNLAEGGGTGVGAIVVGKVMGVMGKGREICIVRNVGEKVARLARWEVA